MGNKCSLKKRSKEEQDVEDIGGLKGEEDEHENIGMPVFGILQIQLFPTLVPSYSDTSYLF